MALKDNRTFVLFCVLCVVLLWSGNFIFIKFVLKEFDVFTALFYRLLLVFLILFPFVKKPEKKDFLFLLLTSIVLVPGHYGLLFLSLKHTQSVGAISVVIQLAIPFSILLSWIIFADSPGRMRLTGLSIAFVGIIAMFYEPSSFKNITALLIGTASAFCLGLYFILVKKLKNLSSLSIITYTSLFGLPFIYIIMLFNDESLFSILEIKDKMSWFSFLYTVIAGSILGHGLWAWLVKWQSISLISPFLLSVPMFAVFLSAIVFKETITIEFLLTASIIILGIFLVFMAKKNTNVEKT
ncbi:MAG: DMT family transporter [Campylobacteraceae bacterium]|nr:DMT family transporter [Campylobacteraceae bacterium]